MSLKLCNQQGKAGQTTTSYFQWVLDKTTRTLILVAERLVLRDILQQTTDVNWVLCTLWKIDYFRVSTTHLHPLLGLAHRLQVASYRRRVDKVIC
jgi:hypothetical protein